MVFYLMLFFFFYFFLIIIMIKANVKYMPRFYITQDGFPLVLQPLVYLLKTNEKSQRLPFYKSNNLYQIHLLFRRPYFLYVYVYSHLYTHILHTNNIIATSIHFNLLPSFYLSDYYYYYYLSRLIRLSSVKLIVYSTRIVQMFLQSTNIKY